MNTLYADIIVDISHEKLDRTFQYRVPESLRGRLEPGACVMIPFGNGNRLIKGYVVALGETCQFAPEKIKDIAGMPEKETGVEDKMIALAAWIRRNYGCTMIQALKTVLPAKQSVKKLEHRQLVRLMNREEILSLLGECERKKQVAKARLLKALSEQETIPYEWITGKLGVSAATVNSIVKSGAAKLVSSESYRNPVKMQSVEAVRNTLSEEQQTIVTEVLKDFDAGRRQTYLIHGITGSGKTEVYGRTAVIGGGMVGCETAEYLAERGCSVSVIEMLDKIAAGESETILPTLKENYERFGVKEYPSHKVEEIQESSVICKNKEDEKVVIDCDFVVLAMGARPVAFDTAFLDEAGIPFAKIGDCGERASDISNAVRTAYDTVNAIR